MPANRRKTKARRVFPALPKKQACLPGLGPKGTAALAAVGIRSIEVLRASDPYEVYRRLKARFPMTNLNFLYTLIAVIEDSHWRVVKQTRRTEILLRLDDMGLAPKK